MDMMLTGIHLIVYKQLHTQGPYVGMHVQYIRYALWPCDETAVFSVILMLRTLIQFRKQWKTTSHKQFHSTLLCLTRRETRSSVQPTFAVLHGSIPGPILFILYTKPLAIHSFDNTLPQIRLLHITLSLMILVCFNDDKTESQLTTPNKTSLPDPRPTSFDIGK